MNGWRPLVTVHDPTLAGPLALHLARQTRSEVRLELPDDEDSIDITIAERTAAAAESDALPAAPLALAPPPTRARAWTDDEIIAAVAHHQPTTPSRLAIDAGYPMSVASMNQRLRALLAAGRLTQDHERGPYRVARADLTPLAPTPGRA